MVTKLIKKTQVARETMSFYFEKPTGFDFKAGQSIDLTLTNPPKTDTKGNTRPFSLASAPSEPNLMITTRMRESAFKNNLKQMAIGTEVQIEGPFGSMTLHSNSNNPAVILAGGIGITPFRSIVLQATYEKLPHKILLFYSNRRPQDAAFLEELEKLQAINNHYHLVATMTQFPEWPGPIGNIPDLQAGISNGASEKDYINKEMIKKYVHDTSLPIYYIAGPVKMVKALYDLLIKIGADPDSIRFEEFSGY